MELAADGAVFGRLVELVAGSQRAFAAQVGTSHHTINRLATGQVAKCQPELVGRIEAALKLPPATLFREQEVSRHRRVTARQRAA